MTEANPTQAPTMTRSHIKQRLVGRLRRLGFVRLFGTLTATQKRAGTCHDRISFPHQWVLPLCPVNKYYLGALSLVPSTFCTATCSSHRSCCAFECHARSFRRPLCESTRWIPTSSRLSSQHPCLCSFLSWAPVL